MIQKVLAVDDEEPILELIKAMISATGCEVRTCADSRRAAQIVAGEKFDAIFVDARMPSLDGFALTRAIRSSILNHTTPVVMVTGYDDVQTLRQGFRAGITFFLGKPFSHDRFLRLFKVLNSAGWKEKRRSTRLPLRTPVRWRAGPRSGASLSVDLSHEGMLLENAAELRMNEEVDLEFSLRGESRLLEIRARVTHKEESGRAVVRFLNCRPIEQEAILRFLSGEPRAA